MPKLQKLYLGIDPGGSGGIAFITETGKAKTVYAMPATELDVLEAVQEHKVEFCVLEKVWSMPGEGHAGAFKFGMGFGGLCMALIASRIPHELTAPQTWMKGLSIPKRKPNEGKTAWKNRLKGEAQRLFPDVGVTLKTADALLIAEYSRRKQTGRLL